MKNSKAIVTFNNIKDNISVDLEVPLDISAHDLVIALNSVYSLGINEADIKNCYLKAEKPIVLLRGSRTLEDLGVRNGTEIFYTE